MLYNGLQQRAYKSSSIGARYYVYDEDAQLLGEYDSAGVPIHETIYLGTTPMGVLKQTGTAGANNIAVITYNAHADHIDTPRVITKQDHTIVWRWDAAEAFGATVPNQDPNGLGEFPFSQRGRGQVQDAESGLVDNINRQLDPRTGRYDQFDPLGLSAAINGYLHVGGNPLSMVDPSGLICEYSQSTGSFACRNAGGQTYTSCSGYSGKGEGVNNPAAQNQKNVGPIPQGTYTVGGFTTRRGANTRPLTPDPTNKMYGRAGFLLHGDNSERNNTASEGCIIIPPRCRTAVPAGETLVVLP
jgi:RHS repeat-associated protein